MKQNCCNQSESPTLSDMVLFRLAQTSDLCAIVLLNRWGYRGPAIPKNPTWYKTTGKKLVAIIRKANYVKHAKEKVDAYRTAQHPH